jgi:hypothetical protein
MNLKTCSRTTWDGLLFLDFKLLLFWVKIYLSNLDLFLVFYVLSPYRLTLILRSIHDDLTSTNPGRPPGLS